MSNKKVWYVTGASKGLGLALVKRLLQEGYRVAATSRTIKSLVDAVGVSSDRFLPLEVDLTNEASVDRSMKDTQDAFGRIDVVVNNAGYGIGGTVEELSSEEVRQSFEINVFAVITVMQKAMPYLRVQGSGHIINISSIAGFTGGMGWSVYAAAKHAVIGLSEVLAQDVQGLGIKVTAVAPGAFRTQFLTEESLSFSKKRIDAYKDVRASHQRYLAMDGNQAGDPDKAALALITIAEHPEPPVVLFLGSDAYDRANTKINKLTDQMNKWKDLTHSTSFSGELIK